MATTAVTYGGAGSSRSFDWRPNVTLLMSCPPMFYENKNNVPNQTKALWLIRCSSRSKFRWERYAQVNIPPPGSLRRLPISCLQGNGAFDGRMQLVSTTGPPFDDEISVGAEDMVWMAKTGAGSKAELADWRWIRLGADCNRNTQGYYCYFTQTEIKWVNFQSLTLKLKILLIIKKRDDSKSLPLKLGGRATEMSLASLLLSHSKALSSFTMI